MESDSLTVDAFWSRYVVRHRWAQPFHYMQRIAPLLTEVVATEIVVSDDTLSTVPRHRR